MKTSNINQPIIDLDNPLVYSLALLATIASIVAVIFSAVN